MAKTTATERSKKYREQIRNDPDKLRMAKEQDKLRKQKERAKPKTKKELEIARKRKRGRSEKIQRKEED